MGLPFNCAPLPCAALNNSSRVGSYTTPAMRRAEELAAAGDLFLAIGSSLVVWPAAGLPLLAKRNGARLVILNREPTDFDAVADLVVHTDIGAALEAFIVS